MGPTQFGWLCDVCGCVMSSTSSIYWVDLGFINNYKESQLWLVFLRYSAYVASSYVANAFPWVVTVFVFENKTSFSTSCFHGFPPLHYLFPLNSLFFMLPKMFSEEGPFLFSNIRGVNLVEHREYEPLTLAYLGKLLEAPPRIRIVLGDVTMEAADSSIASSRVGAISSPRCNPSSSRKARMPLLWSEV